MIFLMLINKLIKSKLIYFFIFLVGYYIDKLDLTSPTRSQVQTSNRLGTAGTRDLVHVCLHKMWIKQLTVGGELKLSMYSDKWINIAGRGKRAEILTWSAGEEADDGVQADRTLYPLCLVFLFVFPCSFFLSLFFFVPVSVCLSL